jgi:prevent-host-death family protein
MKVPAAEFQRNIGVYQDKALVEPVFVTRNGRPRTVLVSVEEYQRLKRRDREALRVEELSERDLAAIAAAKVDPRHARLDEELEG